MEVQNENDKAQKHMVVNGLIGTVEDVDAESVWVAFDNGETVNIPQRSSQFDPQREDSATMTQIPLRPAYALTIHKSQGLTLNSAHIDIRAAREPGQAYVALSRLRSIGGLYLKDWIKGVHVSEAAINFYKNLK
jgi:ATP-dependent exoDNAse (exonuclease V) alpha subunit